MAETSDKKIQIRALTVESTTVSFSFSATVEDLKLVLNQTFLPAIKAPNFHLFFKGSKLKLQSQIDCSNVESNEFLVVVPFAKKESIRLKESNQSEAFTTSANVANSASVSSFADSTWSNIMEDLSYLRENDSNPPKDHNASTFKFEKSTDEPSKDIMAETTSFKSSGEKTKQHIDSNKQKELELPYHLILNTLQYASTDALGEHNCEVLAKILESVNCLSDLSLGHCKSLKRFHLRGVSLGYCVDNGSSCLCPTWLKIIMKVFTFINIFSAFLHLQCKETTSILLEEALDQLGKYGVKLGLQDMKHLSLLCPQLICFSNHIEKTNFDDVIIIFNYSRSDKNQAKDNPKTAGKWLYVSKIVSTLKRRDTSFRYNLWQAFEQLLCASGGPMALEISMDDLLTSVKDHGSTGIENKAKHMKRSSTKSKSNLDHIGCHETKLWQETKSLLAVEMVEHLQRGIGSEGQAKSIQASLSGKNVVVATMTSSGKSLCYNLPVLEVLSKNSSSCALYIFPTKALAQDQLRALSRMTSGFDIDLNIGIYDGDTSQNDRTWQRYNSRLLITNPDMLHISILPHHQRFSRILSNLRFVVIDETHTYKGAFGCHTALILRRLKRLCSHVYGTVPSFVFSTATSANPREHCMMRIRIEVCCKKELGLMFSFSDFVQNMTAYFRCTHCYIILNYELFVLQELANLSTLVLIRNDGSPSARKLFVLWSQILHPNPFL